MLVHGFMSNHGILVIPCYRLFLIWPWLFKRWIALSTEYIIIKRISVKEINCTIHYPVDSAITF